MHISGTMQLLIVGVIAWLFIEGATMLLVRALISDVDTGLLRNAERRRDAADQVSDISFHRWND